MTAVNESGYKIYISLTALKMGFTPSLFGNGNIYTIGQYKTVDYRKQ